MKHPIASSHPIKTKAILLDRLRLNSGNQKYQLPWLVPFHKLVKILFAGCPDLRFQIFTTRSGTPDKFLRMLVKLLTQHVKVIKVSLINNLAPAVINRTATGKELSRMIIYQLLSDVTESIQLVLVVFHKGRFKLQYSYYITPQRLICIKSLPAADFRALYIQTKT
jgi:hypothetical protein